MQQAGISKSTDTLVIEICRQVRAMYRASIGITTSIAKSATDWIGQNAELIGMEGIWIGEDIGIGQEISILITSLLESTESVRVGTGIVPIAVHNLSTIARMALTLQEIAKGRFVLGVGLGGTQDLHKLGLQVDRPVSTLRDTARCLNRLFNAETVTIDSELIHLTEYSLRINQPINIPIFFGVRGPQMLKLAGSVADGVILSGPTEYLKYAIDVVNTAAARGGRSPESIEKVVWRPTIPTFKGGNERLAKRVVALVVADTPEQVLDLLEIDKERAHKIRDVVAVSGPKAAVDLIDQQFIETFAISGTREHMVDRFEEIHKLGATELVVGPPFSGNWRGAVTEIFNEIQNRRVVN
jgi:5,10-methylenetetrahydromethanopterin reductase